MMRFVILAGIALAAIGCNAGTEATATAKEENGFRNPSKEPPPEAANIGGPPPEATRK